MGIIDQIKEKLDIVELIGEYIKLTKAGSNFKALCPFHKEKTPSFMVSPERQIWHCFGCHRGGDIFKFVMQYENLDFADALKILAKKAGIELKKEDPLIANQISKLYDIYEKATEFFEEELKKNKAVQDYLLKRGLKKETISYWQLGFAPNQRDALLRFLLSNKFKIEDIVDSGLVIKSQKQNDSYFDRFRNRIIFPIFNHQDRIVAFTGRIFGESINEPKYLNSPESPIFNKSQILYGFSKTKKDIREKNWVLLVEGQMDFLMAWQSGIKNVVATSGTALTEDQLRILKRITKNLVIGYDMDEAGRLAAERAIDLAKFFDFQVKIVSLPEAKDIAEYASNYPEKLEEVIHKASDAGEYYYQKALSKYNPNNLLEKKQAIEFLLSKLAYIDNPVERAEWLRRIAEDFQIKEEFLQELLEKIKKNLDMKTVERREEKILLTGADFLKTRKELLSERVLALALKVQIIQERLKEISDFLNEEQQKLASLIIDYLNNKKEVENESWEKIGYLQLLADYEFSDEEIDWNLEFEKIVLELKKEHHKQLIEEKTRQLKTAELNNNIEEISRYLQELNQLLKEVNF
ncbi:MAG: DNA primase [Patescibacteria group bacterium]|jgi:DNA primase|nr:DNA primase [Patescibacteria group bacterium]